MGGVMVWHDNFRSIAKNYAFCWCWFYSLSQQGGCWAFYAIWVNLYICMSYRFSDEEFYRGFFWIFEPFLCWRFGLPEDGFGIFRWIIVEALVLPRLCFEVCQQVGIRFLLKDYVSRLIRFYRNAVMNRPLPVGRVSPLSSWILLPFSGGMLISWEYILTMIFGF